MKEEERFLLSFGESMGEVGTDVTLSTLQSEDYFEQRPCDYRSPELRILALGFAESEWRYPVEDLKGPGLAGQELVLWSPVTWVLCPLFLSFQM